jgi:RNA polymerase sigma factor (sigma-70 family)
MDELLCVQQVLSGNTSAFAYFVETYQDMAMTIALRVCENMQDAEDIVQESYLKAFRNLHSFRGDSKFSTWFYRIVYNTAVTHAKVKIWTTDYGKEAEEVPALSDYSPEMRLEESEKKEMVSKILDHMPKGDALLLTLYYMEDHSVKEVAKITGLNESNVKVKLFRARKVFKEMLLNYLRLDHKGCCEEIFMKNGR